jgi:hypothetical protein|tara:strand:+ start:233 stop:379 length:147 start_codon:yes stop_codon:yes gene_type:complete
MLGKNLFRRSEFCPRNGVERCLQNTGIGSKESTYANLIDQSSEERESL